jgi:hypothetical protein
MRLARLGVVSLVLAMPAVASANDVKVTVKSFPEGATVFTVQPNGMERPWGGSPVRLKWQLPRKWTQCIMTESVKVKWVSGVEATVSGLEVCPQNGKNQEYTFQRPKDAPGVEVDVQYAIAVMQSAATAAAAAAESYSVPYFPAPPPRQKICTSNIVGNQIFTYCY